MGEIVPFKNRDLQNLPDALKQVLEPYGDRVKITKNTDFEGLNMYFEYLMKETGISAADCLTAFMLARYQCFYKENPHLLDDTSEVSAGGRYRKAMELGHEQRTKLALEHYNVKPDPDTQIFTDTIRDIEKQKFAWFMKIDTGFDFSKRQEITLYYDPDFPITLTISR